MSDRSVARATGADAGPAWHFPIPASFRASRADGPVPLVIGATGHGNLVAAEIPQIRALVTSFLQNLRHGSRNTPLRVITGLAEGADRLVTDEALALGIPVLAVLPMPRALYAEDFRAAGSLQEFENLCARAEVVELPLLPGITAADIGTGTDARNRQYAQLGVFLCAHSHVLLALWDGKESARVGGTSQVVHFHHDDLMPGYTSDKRKYRELLADDESDLVYHIVVSRDQPDGGAAASFQALQASWFTTDETNPRPEVLPLRYQLIFSRTSDFNADAARHAAAIDRERRDLPPTPPDRDAGALAAVNELFVTADWLAGHFQHQFHAMLRRTHTIAVSMGLAYIAYSDVRDDPIFIAVFLALFCAGLLLVAIATRRAWHRKYLDYRALAEGLRVQYFWAASGIHGGQSTKFAHDNFLQKQDVELGWIRNVMRVAGLQSDLRATADPEGLRMAISQWIGDERSGQTGYYAMKARTCATLQSRTEFISLACLSIGLFVALGLAIYHAELSNAAKIPLKALMGILPLIAATRDAYSQKKAEKELVKQYRFMHRVFRNAQRQLANARTDDDRREILRAVGDAALDEHAEWILIHRERPLEMSGL